VRCTPGGGGTPCGCKMGRPSIFPRRRCRGSVVTGPALAFRARNAGGPVGRFGGSASGGGLVGVERHDNYYSTSLPVKPLDFASSSSQESRWLLVFLRARSLPNANE
jgi:hypothetical protein